MVALLPPPPPPLPDAPRLFPSPLTRFQQPTPHPSFSTHGIPRITSELPLPSHCAHPPIHPSLAHHHIHVLCRIGRLDAAVDSLFRSQIPPPEDVYLLLLKSCARNKDVFQAKRICSHLRQHNVELSRMLGDYLVVALAKSGALEEARRFLHLLPRRTVFTWTAMISSYHERGDSEEAFRMYESMLQDGVEPDGHTFATLIKVCISSRDLQEGRRFHAEAVHKDLALDVFVGNSLVTMYGKCRSLKEAENVFVAMPERNFNSWTSMISAYVESGQFKKALLLYRQMLEEKVYLCQHTFAVALQACYGLSKHAPSRATCLDIGQGLHADLKKYGLSSNVFVSTVLINIYGRCGRIKEAENVFSALPQCDIVSWNAMLYSYIEDKQGDTALRLFMHMQKQSVAPDQKTFVMALRACVLLAGEEESLQVEGKPTKIISTKCFQAIHADAKREGFTSDFFFGTTILGMYAKCGMITEAENAFSALPWRDVVSWTAMLTAYIEQGLGGTTLLLYRQMQDEAVDANGQTYVVVIQACGILAENENAAIEYGAALEIGKALHADARRRGLDSNVYVATALVGMYATCGSIAEAENVFCGLHQYDVVAWNAMLTAYVDQEHGEKALQLYKVMLEEGMNPNQKTFVVILQACSLMIDKAGHLSSKHILFGLVIALHSDLKVRGFASNVFIGNSLVTIYGKFGSLKDANDVFIKLTQHETVSWNAMLSAYLEDNNGEAALELYAQMQNKGAILNDVTHLCLLQACSKTGSLKVCQEIHFSIVSAGYDLNPSLAATLIHAYGNCSSMTDARAVHRALPHPDVVSWNACIAGSAAEGNYETCVHILKEMHQEGIDPDEVTLASVLSACSHSGLVTQGLDYFEGVCRNYNVTPDVKHYSTVIDLLGRAGDLQMLEGVLERIPVESDLSIWLPLLGASRMHQNTKLGKQAFHCAVNLKTRKAAAFVIMSNIYANSEIQECLYGDDNYG